jgi:two-component system nitrogen regulation response regulator GlnG
LPPLRERTGDLPLLVGHFLRLANRSLGREVRAVTPEAMAVLERHGWPGNVRELQSAVRYAVVQSAGDVVTPEDLPESVRGTPAVPAARSTGGLDVEALVGELLRSGSTEVYRTVTQAVDRVVLEAVLRHAGGNQVRASELLGISRTTLRAKLQGLGGG